MQMQDRVGQQFGNYRLMRLIGEGGYAEVYLAEHIYLHNQQAIKVLTGTNLKHYQQEEFLAEARTIADLQNLDVHIVQIQDVGIQVGKDENGADIGIPYLVMEYAPGGTLRNLYPYGTKVPLDRIVFYVNQVAEALQCAHERKPPIVHRDVKPENMLLRNKDHVLLSDFGIAVSGKTGPLPKPEGTIPIAGTVGYIAPEQLSGHTRRASDQYSLGIVVYEWLCGSRPFDGTDKEVCYKQLTAQPPPLSSANSQVTKEIEDVVMRALAKKPEDRYSTVQEFAHALEGAVQSALRQQKQMWQEVINAGKQQGRQAGPAQNQLNLRQGLYPQNNNVGTTVPRIPRQALPPRIAVPKPVSQPSRKIAEFFEFSFGFMNYSLFLIAGIIVNILSAVIFGLLLNSVLALLIGLVFPNLIFVLCVCAVEEKLARFFGALVAIYWGVVGWESGSFIALPLHLNKLVPSVFIGVVFFSISITLHIRYVSRKNL